MKDILTPLACVAARPGALRSVLEALVIMMPQVDMMGVVEDIPSAMRIVREHPSALVILDVDLPGGDVLDIVHEIKLAGLQNRCLVLANDVWQCLDAKAAGADTVLLKGTPPVDLLLAIEALASKA
jgi:DNA-binding NarL/FixJ family response regulator